MRKFFLVFIVFVFSLCTINSIAQERYERDLDYVIQVLNNQLEGSSEETKASFAQALELLKSSEFNKAEKAFIELAEKPSNSRIANIGLAASYYLDGNHNRCEETYARLLQADQNLPIAYYHLGSIYTLRHNFDKAEEYIGKSLELDPDNKDAMITMGTLFVLRGDSAAKAVSSLRRAYKDYNEDPDVNFELGNLYYERESYKESTFFYNRAIQLGLDEDKHHTAYAKSLYYEGNPDEAYKIFKKVLKNNNRNAEALFYLGAVLLDREKYSRAVNALEKAEKLAKELVDVKYFIAVGYFQQGLYERSMDKLIEFRIAASLQDKKHRSQAYDKSLELMLEIEKLKEIVRKPNQIPGSMEGMVEIEGGEFLYQAGAKGDNEAGAITLKVSRFAMDIYEVSNSDYQVFLKATGRPAPKVTGKGSTIKNMSWGGNIDSLPEGIADLPVFYVSWDDAVAYAAWAGKRLPRESEWEYAARGGRKFDAYPWGRNAPNGDEACYGRAEGPRNIDEGEPNEFGLINIVGNAAEWCLDHYYADAHESLEKQREEVHRNFPRAYRGGHWRSAAEDLKVFVRNGMKPKTKSAYLGFRCVADLPEKK